MIFFQNFSVFLYDFNFISLLFVVLTWHMPWLLTVLMISISITQQSNNDPTVQRLCVGDWVGSLKQIIESTVIRKTNVLYYPIMLSHFLHSLGNYTRRAIFPEMRKINQSSVNLHRLIAWLTVSQFWLDWFIGIVPSDLFLRGRG